MYALVLAQMVDLRDITQMAQLRGCDIGGRFVRFYIRLDMRNVA